MSTYKLIYFNARGAAETARLILAATGTEYEDVRVEREKWQAMKASMPQGQLPVLEVNGKQIPQSGAIVRFLARELGVYGDNNDEMTLVDVILGTIEDLSPPVRQFYQEQDETKKAEGKKKVADEVLPAFFKVMDTLLADKGGEFLVGKKLTLADLAFLATADQLMIMFPDCMKDFPKLTAHREKIMSMPKIKAYLDKRPQTQF